MGFSRFKRNVKKEVYIVSEFMYDDSCGEERKALDHLIRKGDVIMVPFVCATEKEYTQKMWEMSKDEISKKKFSLLNLKLWKGGQDEKDEEEKTNI